MTFEDAQGARSFSSDASADERAHSSFLNWEAWDRYEARCREFECRWQQGESPRAEDWVSGMAEVCREALLEDLLAIEIEYRRRKGERVDEAFFQARFPGRESWLASLFAASRTCETVLVPGEHVGRYRVENLVARGAFGSVYRAYDERLDRYVALKVALGKPGDTIESKQLRHESQILASLCHPHLVPVYDVGELENGSPYFVMEFLSGASLEDRLRQGSVTWRQAVEWMIQVAEAIDYVHRRGLIHRDLKPANIILDANQQARVTDFGLAFVRPTIRARAQGLAGTPCYMAPEQLDEPPRAEPASDIWALGAILYELLTGCRPYAQEELESLVEGEPLPPLPSPSSLHYEVPSTIDAICQRCLQREPSQRYLSAGHLARALRHCLDRRFRMTRRFYLTAASAAVSVGLVAWSLRHLAVPALESDVRVLAWNPRKGPRWVDQPGSLPVTQDDTVRVQVTANQPCYLYVVWVDGTGQALPLYPRPEGSWDWSATTRRRQIGLPDAEGEGWQMEVTRPSMETVLALACRRPLSVRDVRAVKRFFGRWLPQPPVATPSLFVFRNGILQVSSQPKVRKPSLPHAIPLRHPLFVNQRLVRDHLVSLCDQVLALTFSCGSTADLGIPTLPSSKQKEALLHRK